MTANDRWMIAYARQAKADLDTWSILQTEQQVPDCHKLLFLQMACEKLAKAHLCGAGSDPETLQSSHAYIAKNLPIVIRHQITFSGMNLKQAGWIVHHSKHLAQEIELLAPAVKRGDRRPDNCEYPWVDDSGALHVPLDWPFTPSQLLLAKSGRTFLKLIREAITRFLTE